ncbi:MAG TPA: hypothetical protein VNB87_02200 [Propionibacteriaceae bacterium]|nr:hypothetical protein [Propionibacteriaceae bacterium]
MPGWIVPFSTSGKQFADVVADERDTAVDADVLVDEPSPNSEPASDTTVARANPSPGDLPAAIGHRVEISSGRSPDFSVLPNVLLGTPRRVNQGRKRTGSSASFGRAMHFLSDGGSHLLRMCLLWRCRYTCWCPAARVTEP